MTAHQHENDPLYGWGPPGYGDHEIPAELLEHYREIKPGRWAYVCPSCRSAFPPGLAGMPGAFAAHLPREGAACWLAGGK